MTDEQLAAMHRLLAEYHRKLATESLLDVVQQYHADLAQRLADEAALIPRRTEIVERLHEREESQRVGCGRDCNIRVGLPGEIGLWVQIGSAFALLCWVLEGPASRLLRPHTVLYSPVRWQWRWQKFGLRPHDFILDDRYNATGADCRTLRY